MKKKNHLKAILNLLTFLFLTSCTSTQLPIYHPDPISGNDAFDFESNSFSSEITLDGYLNEAQWTEEKVIQLGSFDQEDILNENYGAIVEDIHHYATTKRGIIKMFRGKIGLYFGFIIQDHDICYSKLEDGDPAIYTDNILVNLCTGIDGSTYPKKDDYYLLITAFNNHCFRKGANASGMWGAFNGVFDYQSAIYYDDNHLATGFGVELLIPYSQIQIDQNSPVGVTFLSCDRKSDTNQVVENVWYYHQKAHFFNTPNDYIIWGEDNCLYDYYDYARPNVNITGTLIDYVTQEPLANVNVAGEKSNESGEFILQNVNANQNIELTFEGENVLEGQTFFISKDIMREKNGGTLYFSIPLLTKTNSIIRTMKGSIISSIDKSQIEIIVNQKTFPVHQDGTYEIEFEVESQSTTILIKEKAKSYGFEFEVSLEELQSPTLVKDIELPRLCKLNKPFGKYQDVETYFGWCSSGLFVRFTSPSTTNGYGIVTSSDNQHGTLILYHEYNTICVKNMMNPSWNYDVAESFSIQAKIHVNAKKENVYTLKIPFHLLKIQEPMDLKIIPFEYASTGEFCYYTDEANKTYTFSSEDEIKTYPTLSANATLQFVEPSLVTSSYVFEPFGLSNASCLMSQLKGNENGIEVKIQYTKKDSVWGYGILFYDFTKDYGSCDLYAIGYGTIDHREYGNWIWNGNYVFPSTLGITAVETSNSIRLFYPYETLNGNQYQMSIDENSTIGIQLFEYVLDASGEFLSVYNCIRVDGEMIRFDTGSNSFINWNLHA